MPGIGYVLRSLEDAVTVWSISVEDVQAKSISIEDLISWLDSDKGQTCFQEVGNIIRVAPQSTLWIPYGMLSAIVAIEDINLRKPASAVGIPIITYTYFSTDAVSQLPAPVWKSIKEWNTTYFDRKKRDDIMGPMAALWKQFNT